MYNRNKKTNIRRFKSYTDITNYNNFLLELDKKQTKDKIHHFDNVNHIDETLKNISKSFINTTSISITSVTNKNSLKYDPNLYDTTINDATINDAKLDIIEKKKVNISIEINHINDLLLLIEK